MHIVLATSNEDKVKEIKAFLSSLHVKRWDEVCEVFEIEENGKTFQDNAIIKAQTLYDFLGNEKYIVLSDDSGLSVPLLGGAPGIYSARFAGEDANYKQNTAKLVQILHDKNLKKTPAFYTTCVAIASKWGVFSAHGYMHGDVICEIRGDKGFGYDPIFIPNGHTKTLGELEESQKLEISHRSKALNLAKIILKNLPKGE